jgi:hypothetical protein
MMNKKFSSAALATAAAVLFASAPVITHAAEEAKVKCEGVNACKGKSACSTAKNACAGQNACKGAGYVLLPKAECDAAKAAAKKS